MAYNNNINSGRGFSKFKTSEQDAADRRAAQERKRRGKNPNPNKKNPALRFDPAQLPAGLLTGDPNQKTAMAAAFDKFFKKDYWPAFGFIRALVTMEDRRHDLLKELGLSDKMVPDLDLLILQMEIQYREHVAPDFMTVHGNMPEAVRTAFDKLYARSHVIALQAYNICNNFRSWNGPENWDHALDLLSCDDPTGRKNFGGVCFVVNATVKGVLHTADRKALGNYLYDHHVKKPDAGDKEDHSKEFYNLLKAVIEAGPEEEVTEDAVVEEAETSYESKTIIYYPYSNFIYCPSNILCSYFFSWVCV